MRGNGNDTDDVAAVRRRRDQRLEHARRVDAELRGGLRAVLRARDVRVLVHAEVDARVIGGAGRGRGAGHPRDATEPHVTRTVEYVGTRSGPGPETGAEPSLPAKRGTRTGRPQTRGD